MTDRTYFVEFGRAAYMTGLPHRVRQPEYPGPHPTVVLSHGRHGNEDVTWIFARTFPKEWLVVAPRAIEYDPEIPGGDDGWSWVPGTTPLWPTLDDFSPAVTALSDFVKALPDAYDADPRATFLLGFSQGAAAGLATAIEHRDLFRGLAVLVGFAPEIPQQIVGQKPLQALPIYMATGKRDEKIPLAVAHQCRDQLQAAGADLDYREYETGHRLNSEGIRDLSDWWRLRQQELG